MQVSRFAGRMPDAGYTLIEVMITVAIVAILAAVAIPNYSDYVTRGKIIDATTKLGDFRTQMEKFFMDNRTYLAGAACGVPDPPVGAEDNFAITCGAATATTYTVTATGIAARGMSGFTYTVNQTNLKTSSGPGGKYTNGSCWAIRKDGSC